jgi:hypothetical protein
MSAKPHLSPTQLEMIAKCPEAYRRRYVEGEKIPPGIAMAIGSGFHVGAETNFRQKIESYVDLTPRQIEEAAVAGYETSIAGGISFTTDEVGQGAANVIGAAKRDLADMAFEHAKKQAPDYQPVMVEQPVKIELPGPRDLLMVIDIFDDQGRVTDFKTARKSKKQADADTSIQLTGYAAAVKALTGEAPAESRLDTVIISPKKISRQVLSTQHGDGDFVALANRINAVNGLIQSGNFPPASPGAWNCSQKWCGFFSTCRFVNSERKSLAERNDQ